MPRRTREQKIIADLRRQLQQNRPVKLSPAASATKVESTISLPIVTPAQTAVTSEETASYLRGDLLRVGMVVALATAIEIFVSYSVSTGIFRSFGII